MDLFQVDAGVNVGEVTKITVSHDNANLAAGWLLLKVIPFTEAATRGVP